MQVNPRRTSRSTKNFIAMNKSACASRKEITTKSHEKVREETEKRKPRRLLPSQLSENVTIPREYLQHLLQKEHLDDYNSLPISLAQPTSPLSHTNYITPLDHIEEDRLDESYFQQAASLSEDDERMMSLHPAAKGTLRTAHGQWLDDIAAQIQEEERLIREQQNEQAAEFFSYDRLGSSLPVDYQKKARNERHHRRHTHRSPSSPYGHSLPHCGHGYNIPSSHHHTHRRYERSLSPSPSPPPAPGSYHRGTTNRPVHPSMRSSIPFGPGGDSEDRERPVGRAMPRDRTRKVDDKDVDRRPNHSHSSGSHHQHKTSHYGRGAGPHVNEYVLQEKNDRMTIEEQHKEYLKQQMLEKQREREAEKLRKQKQELEDERRIEKEREQIEREFRREQEKAKEKTEAVNKRQKIIEDEIKYNATALNTGTHRKWEPTPQSTKIRRSSKISLHSTSSEETAVTVQFKGRKGRLPIKKKSRPSLPGRLSAVRRQKPNQSDSETDQRKHPGRGKTVFASANSVARAGSMKPGVMQQPVANPHVRAKTDTPHQPDIGQTAPPPPPLSPPVPALARKIAEQQRQQHSNRLLSLPSISEQAQSITSIDNQEADSNQINANVHCSQSMPVHSTEVVLPPLPPASHTIPRIEIKHAATRKILKLPPISNNCIDSSTSVKESHQELIERPPSSSPLSQPMTGDADVLNLCLPSLIEVGSSQVTKSLVTSSKPNQAAIDLEQKVQIHEQKLKEQEELIKLLLAQLSPQQQQPKNSAKEAAKAQHQVLKQLASLKMGILQSRV